MKSIKEFKTKKCCRGEIKKGDAVILEGNKFVHSRNCIKINKLK